MTYLQRYQSGALKGGISLEESKLIWQEAKDNVLEMMSVVEGLDQREEFSSEYLKEIKSKIDGYGYLINKVCKHILRAEVPDYGPRIEKFCKSISKTYHPDDFSLIIVGDQFHLITKDGPQRMGRAMSFFWSLSMIIRGEDKEKLFYIT